MFRGFYTAASGMIAQQRRTEMLSNNMANANTPGYKADRSSLRAFPEMLLQRMDQVSVPVQKQLNLPLERRVGAVNTGVYMQETMPDFSQGDLRETGLRTDVALVDVNVPVNEDTGQKGMLFFKIQGQDGVERYTRNGNFTLDSAGFLTTAAGHYVLDPAGNRIQLNSDNIAIDETGQITEEGRPAGRIGLAFAEDPNRLIKEGNGLLRLQTGTLPAAAGQNNVQFRMQQGFLEGSNTDAGRSMTDMMSAYRTFEANQKVLAAYDRSMEKAANEIGRVN
ncbi:flagellar hook-basal body protein [Bacillus badius]|uniref:Flagellar basal-body rod protein FlgF n=1 Tax=Bacillus badius TaxID=1455 RepID=A0ABR5AV74_BACBA|nr:flagellar hook-basal body protein [Bacillus badius]KIL76535.1 Flagellar basal-body rod protein FlgF [Bacillus badius]KIL78651.1 Flagellar basal-body rod protein FlgF [Bacillus badius]KZN99955.1 flagellar biosynthesis protein FlgC [Bacillus badius]KZR57577.1 flagellar biosynthesis protein FlgC [Bacillus badius]MED0665987.1 flagellar hook-basal body protein [Bacillus badius]